MTERPIHPIPIANLGPRISQAFEFARRAHDGQFRKGTAIPYISHPMAVCSLALSFGASENEAIGALLHDTAEDGGGEAILSDIQEIFGPDVVAIVRGCSDSLTDVSEQKAPWHERKEHHVKLLATADRSVRLVAASDKLHNLQTILADLQTEGPALWKRFKAGPRDQLWYYASCHARLGDNPAEPWSGPLGEAVDALRSHIENNT